MRLSIFFITQFILHSQSEFRKLLILGCVVILFGSLDFVCQYKKFII